MLFLALKIILLFGFVHMKPIEDDFFFVTNEFTTLRDETATTASESQVTTFTAAHVTKVSESQVTTSTGSTSTSEHSNFEIELVKDESTITARIKTYGPYATAGIGFAIFSFVVFIAYKKK